MSRRAPTGFAQRGLRLGPIAVLITLAACGPNATVIFGELDPGARSLIIGLEHDGEFSFQAARADRPFHFEVPALSEDARALRIFRVQLAPTLEALGLAEGRLEPAPDPHRTLGSITRLADEWAVPKLGESVHFMPGALDPEVLEFRLPYPPCPGFHFEPIPELEAAGRTMGGVVLPDGGALFSAEAGLVWVREDREPRLLHMPGEYALSVSVSPSGGVWMLSHARLARLELETGAAELEFPRPVGEHTGGLVVLSEAPLRAQVLDLYGRFWTFEGEQWAEAESVPDLPLPSGPIGRTPMFRLDVDAFLAGAQLLGALVRYERGVYRIDLEPGPTGRGFSLIERTRDGEIFVAEDYVGQTHRRREGEWVRAAKIEPGTLSVAPYAEEDLLLFITDRGSYGLMSPSVGVVCGPMQLATYATLRDMARIGDRFLVTGAEKDEVPVWGWLRAE